MLVKLKITFLVTLAGSWWRLEELWWFLWTTLLCAENETRFSIKRRSLFESKLEPKIIRNCRHDFSLANLRGNSLVGTSWCLYTPNDADSAKAMERYYENVMATWTLKRLQMTIFKRKVTLLLSSRGIPLWNVVTTSTRFLRYDSCRAANFDSMDIILKRCGQRRLWSLPSL